MKCKKCGAELSDDAEFCPVCRSSVGGTEQEAVSCTAPPAPTPEPENIPPEEPEDYSAGAAEPVIAPVKKPRKMCLAVSVVLSVVFGMLTMFVCQTAAVLCTFSGALSSHAVSEQITGIDVGSIEIGSLIPDNIKEQFGIDPSEITGDIAGIVSRFSGGAMSSGQAAEIIRKADISKDIAKIVQSYEDFIMSGKSDVDISAELQRIILGAKQVYKDVTGMEVPADFDQDVINALKENAEALQQAAPQAALGVMGDTLRIVFSPAVWIAAFVLSALFPFARRTYHQTRSRGSDERRRCVFRLRRRDLDYQRGKRNGDENSAVRRRRYDEGVFKCAWRQAYDLRSGACCGGRSAYRGIYRREGHVGKEAQKSIKYTAVRKDRRFYSPSAVSCIQYKRRQKGE